MTKAIKISGTMKEFEVTVLPKGSYELSIIKVEETVSQKSNNHVLAVDFSVMSGDHTSKTFRDWFVILEKDFPFKKLVGLFEAADPDCEIHDLVENGVDDAGEPKYLLEVEDSTALVGRCLIADCEPGEDDKGRPRTITGNLYPLEEEAGAEAPTNGAQKVEAAPPPQQEAAPPPQQAPQQEQGTRRRRPRTRQ